MSTQPFATFTTPPFELSVRLADEGVPLRAIARATNIPSEDVRAVLRHAVATGQLLELPKEDWPPGFPRDQRALQLSRMQASNPEQLLISVQRIFRLSASQASLFLMLLQHPHISKARLDKAHKTVDVHVCQMRPKLALLGLDIETLWGYGYQLSPADRKRAMDMVIGEIADTSTNTADQPP